MLNINNKKILFITHELSRTGAPIVLLNVISELLKINKGARFDLIALKNGSLLNEFSEKCNKVFLFSEQKSILYRLIEKILHSFRIKIDLLKFFNLNKSYLALVRNNYNLIYANTIVSIPVACKIKDLSGGTCQVVAHIHELQTIISMFLPDFRSYIQKIDCFIAVSLLVKRELVELWGVPEDRIKLVYEFSKISDYKKQNGLKCNQFFEIGASGTVHWRKGHDLFIQVAQILKKNYPNMPVHFKWIGGIDTHHRLIVEGDLRKAGLEDIVEFVGEEKNPIQSYSNFDLFLMPSREDPFPLVCIEVGMLAKPIICFESATGTAEIIQQYHCGTVVPYLDTEAMANAVARYYENADLLKVHGESAQTAFSQFDPVRQCKLIENSLNKMLED